MLDSAASDSPRILLTGASGTLGGELIQKLTDRGANIRCLVHRTEVSGCSESVRGDITVPATLAPAVQDIETVIHLAAITHSRRARDYDAVNTAGTRNVVEAASRASVRRFVHVSSRAVGSEGGGYSRSKLAAEEFVRSAGLPAVIVRLPEVLGGGSEGIDRVLGSVAAGRPAVVPTDPRAGIAPILLEDAVAVLAEAAMGADARPTTYTVAGPGCSIREFALTAKQILDSPSRIIGVPTWVLALLCGIARFAPLPVYPDQLARLLVRKPKPSGDEERDLGHVPRDLEELIRGTAAGLGGQPLS